MINRSTIILGEKMLHNLAKIMLLAVAQITISTSNVSSETQRNCSFLEDYYFQQENAVADTLDCLEVGYSPNVVRSSDKSTIFHLILTTNLWILIFFNLNI